MGKNLLGAMCRPAQQSQTNLLPFLQKAAGATYNLPCLEERWELSQRCRQHRSSQMLVTGSKQAVDSVDQGQDDAISVRHGCRMAEIGTIGCFCGCLNGNNANDPNLWHMDSWAGIPFGSGLGLFSRQRVAERQTLIFWTSRAAS